jgi:hypothetical protein
MKRTDVGGRLEAIDKVESAGVKLVKPGSAAPSPLPHIAKKSHTGI